MDLQKLSDDIINLVSKKQTVWDNHDVIISIPILYCGWLYYQCLYIDNKEYKISVPVRINLFKKGYYVYQYIWDRCTNNIIIDNSNKKYYENITKNIIFKLQETGMFGKACNVKQIKNIISTTDNNIHWTNDGILYVNYLEKPMSSWLD